MQDPSSLIDCLKEGKPLNLRTQNDVGDDPVTSGPTWGPERTVQAKDIAEALWKAPSGVYPHGLVVQGAKIEGELRLQAFVVSFPVLFEQCYFEHPPSLSQGRFSLLRFRKCFLPGLDAKELVTNFDFDLEGSRIQGKVCLELSKIGGYLRLEGCKLEGTLLANGASIECVVLRNSAIEGEVRFVSAEIRKDLDLSGSTLRNPGNTAVHCDSAVIGDAFLRGCTLEGEVRFTQAKISGELALSGSTLRNPGNTAVHCDSAVIGNAFLRECTLEGEIRFLRAKISADLDLSMSTLTATGERALDCSGASLGFLILNDGTVRNPGNVAVHCDWAVIGNASLLGCTLEGEIRFLRAKISGELDLSGSTLRNPGNTAVNCGSAVIGDAFLRGCTLEGEVRFTQAKISGELDLSGSTLRNPGNTAVHCDSAVIGNAFLRECTLEGQIRFLRAKISGELDLSGSTLRNPGNTAVNCGSAVIGDAFLRGCTLEGEVRFVTAQIKGDLDLSGGVIKNPRKPALICEAASIGRVLLLQHPETRKPPEVEGNILFYRSNVDVLLCMQDLSIDGAITCEELTMEKGTLMLFGIKWLKDGAQVLLNLQSAFVQVLKTDGKSWPPTGTLRLHGFEYSDLGYADGDGQRPPSLQDALEWLRLQPQDPSKMAAYDQLASFYKARGQEKDAVEVLVAKNDDYLAYLEHAKKARGERLYLRMLKWTTGYGYKSWRALVWLAGVSLVGFVLSVYFWEAIPLYAERGASLSQLPLDPAKRVSVLFFYNIENTVPILRLGFTEHYTIDVASWPGKVARFLFLVQQILGWAFSTLFVSGFTGLIKR